MARRTDPTGKIDKIVEVLAQTNEVLDDMLWVEGNQTSGHKTTVRTGLPSATWRMLNYGVAQSKSTTKQVTDTTGMLEAYAEIDKALADLNGNSADYRLSEDSAFLEAMNQEFCKTLMYGDASTPEKFIGFAPRYSSYNSGASATGTTADNVLNAGGTGAANTSIYLVGWGPNTVHGIYPKGTTAGFKMSDLSAGNPDGITLFDANNNKYQGYRTHYKWDCGLTVRDWRYVVRVANIDITALTKNAATGADLIDLMVQAEELLPNTSNVKLSWIVPRTIRSYLRRQIMNKSIYQITEDQVAGKHVTMFDGIPVRRVDQMLCTESSLSAYVAS